jgi:hypothetical protein
MPRISANVALLIRIQGLIGFEAMSEEVLDCREARLRHSVLRWILGNVKRCVVWLGVR